VPSEVPFIVTVIVPVGAVPRLHVSHHIPIAVLYWSGVHVNRIPRRRVYVTCWRLPMVTDPLAVLPM